MFVTVLLAPFPDSQAFLRWIFLPILVLLVPLTLLPLLWHVRSRLLVSADGLGFATFGYAIQTPWQNVVGDGSRSEQNSRSSRPIGGLELRDPATIRQKNVWASLMLMAVDDPFRFVPVSEVIPNWQESEFAGDLRRYAYQIFPCSNCGEQAWQWEALRGRWACPRCEDEGRQG